MGKSNSNPSLYPDSHAFFQPLLPGFLNSFTIPDAFMEILEQELKGDGLRSVVLMREKHRHWLVRIIGGCHFNSEDWKKFALHHELKAGDFLVFRHLGNLVFNVSVFDSVTACDYHSDPPPLKPGEAKVEAASEEEEEKAKAAAFAWRRQRGSLPHCQFTLTSYYANKNLVFLPRRFTRNSGLEHRRCVMTLIDEKKRSWKVCLLYRSDGMSYINQGWKAFQDANGLKPGCIISLQLLNAGKHPLLKCWTGPSRRSPRKAKAGAEKEGKVSVAASQRGRSLLRIPHCQFTLKSTGVIQRKVYLPRRFIRESGLAKRRCFITLIDETKRSWEVWLHCRSDGQSYISQGWTDFQDANRLKLGDAIKLQLLNAGNRPVFKCWKAEAESEVVPSRSGQHLLSSCDVIITSYYSRNNIVYLPRKFVREGGLERRRCVLKLIDQKRRTWKAWLQYKNGDGQTYVNRGWKNFQEANGIKPRDIIKFQLLRAGKCPVLKCYRLSKRSKSA